MSSPSSTTDLSPGAAAAVAAVDHAFVVQVLTDLVRIDSVNPRIAPTGGGEAEIAAYIQKRLDALGLETAIYEPKPGCATSVGRRHGSGGGRSLMLNGHEDTVGVEGMLAPFSAEIRDGKLYGRGAHDMKGSLAAMIGAAKALADARVPLRGDLVIAAVADEEFESVGTADLLTRIRTDGAIVTEPTNLDVCLAHKGFAWIAVETRGRAAHGSRFTEGVDANARMGRVLSALERLEVSLRTGPAHPLVGPPSVHAARLAGGVGLSTYAERCRLEIERRTVPGETLDAVRGEIERLVAALREADSSLQVQTELLFGRNPWETTPEAPVVRAVTRATSAVLGRQPRFVGDTPWMDSALIAEAGIDTVVLGPVGAGEHSDEEWVDVESVVQLAGILAAAAVDYCG